MMRVRGDRVRLGALVTWLGAAACSAEPDVVAVEAPAMAVEVAESPGAPATSVGSPAARADGTVRVWGTVEALPLPGTARSHVADAEVCVDAAGAPHCTRTDARGTYAMDVPRTDTPRALRVRHDGFLTTTTRVLLDRDVSHALGLVPVSLAPSDTAAQGAVLVRGFVSVYSQLSPVAKIDADVVSASEQAHVTSSDLGFALVLALAGGSVEVFGSAGSMACGTWTGSRVTLDSSPFDRTPGTVTEIDVVCGPDLAGL
jgi:hypothetical protein